MPFSRSLTATARERLSCTFEVPLLEVILTVPQIWDYNVLIPLLCFSECCYIFDDLRLATHVSIR